MRQLPDNGSRVAADLSSSHRISCFLSSKQPIHNCWSKHWLICASEPEYTVKQPSLQTHGGGKTTVRHEAKPLDEPANSPVHLALSYSIRPVCLRLEVKHQSPISSPRLTRLIGSPLYTRTAGEWTGSRSPLSGKDLLSLICQLFRSLEKLTVFNW